MRLRMGALICGAALFGALPAFAGPVTINFASPTTLSGHTATYVSGGDTIYAYGYTCSNDALTKDCDKADLYAKTDGIGETGLGIKNGKDSDHEITDDEFVQFDFSSLAHLGISQITFQIESVQNGEGFRVFDSDKKGKVGTFMSSVTGNGSNNPNSIVTDTISVDLASNAFISFSATKHPESSDVLIGSGSYSAAPTPEPGTLFLMGTGLLMAGFGLRRRFAGQQG